MKSYLKLLLVPMLFVLSCDKDDDNPQPTPNPVQEGATLNLQFKSGNSNIEFDTIRYTNAAGNSYGVSRLQFYLSNFEFTNASGSTWKTTEIFYVDAKTGVSPISIAVPFNNYKSLKFNIGLDSSHNISNSLPNTIENQNMAWPDMMGGGYHFLKLEGNFLNQGQSFGYAMHIGKTMNLVTASIIKDFSVSAADNSFNLIMDVNEWFEDPYIYDFNVDGNYSMSDSAAMAKLKANGSDVFTID